MIALLPLVHPVHPSAPSLFSSAFLSHSLLRSFIKLPYREVSNFETARMHTNTLTEVNGRVVKAALSTGINDSRTWIARHERFPAPANSVCLNFKNFMLFSLSLCIWVFHFFIFRFLCFYARLLSSHIPRTCTRARYFPSKSAAKHAVTKVSER